MAKIEKSYAITDAKIQFVSLVDKAANKRQFLITKQEDGTAMFNSFGRIVKAETQSESHQVTGIVYEPMVEDAHGNFMTEEEIRKAEKWFSENGNSVDIQHSFEPFENAKILKSWIAKSDCEINGEPIVKGTWLMTVEISDEETWGKIEKKEITGFSMGGVGCYSTVDEKIEKSEEKKSIAKKLAKLFGFEVIEKGVMDEYAKRTKGENFWNAWYALQNTLSHYDSWAGETVFENDAAKVQEALQEFNTIVVDLFAQETSVAKSLEPVFKAGKKISSSNRKQLQDAYDNLGALLEATKEKETEDDDMTEKEVQKTVDTAIEKALEPFKALLKNDETTPAAPAAPAETPAEGTPVTAEAIQEMVEKAVEKALNPAKEPETVTAENVNDIIKKAVDAALAPALEAKGLPTSLNGQVEKSAEGEAHYMTGMF